MSGALGLLVLVHCTPVLAQSERIVVESQGWELIGDLLIPDVDEHVPGVLMLNKAAGNRIVYESLAQELASKRIASLRLDLPGHGESTNLGTFVPYEREHNPLIWEADKHVPVIVAFLRDVDGIDPERIAIIGASYSGEEAAEAGRDSGYVQAYVMLSPGSFSNESIAAIDSSGVPWLFVAAREERHLQEITELVHQTSTSVELIVIPGTEHATRILDDRPDLNPRIAIWLEVVLSKD